MYSIEYLKVALDVEIENKINKWHAVAAQTARGRSEVSTIQYPYSTFIILGPTKGRGTIVSENSGNLRKFAEISS